MMSSRRLPRFSNDDSLYRSVSVNAWDCESWLTGDRPHTSASSVTSTFDEVESLCLSKSSSSVDSSQCYPQCRSLDLANYNPFSSSSFSFQQHGAHLSSYDRAADLYHDIAYEDMENFHGINNEKIKDTDKLFRRVLGLKHKARDIRSRNTKDGRNSLSDLSESSASLRDSDRGRDLIIPDEEEEEYPFSKYKFNRRPDRGNLARLGRSTSIQSTGSGRFSDIVFSLTDGARAKGNAAACTSSFSSDQSIYWDVNTPSVSSHIPSSNSSPSAAPPREVSTQRSFNVEPSVLTPTTPPEPAVPFTPYTAERMLSDLGFSGSDSFIPERFLKDWYHKLTKSDLESQNTCTSVSVSPTNHKTFSLFNEHDYQSPPKEGHPAGGACVYDSSVPPRPGLVGREHFEHLRECLEKVVAQPRGADIPPSKKRKQWASSKQQSLPLCLETLSENDEEDIRVNTNQNTYRKYKEFHKRKRDSAATSYHEGPSSNNYPSSVNYDNQPSRSDSKSTWAENSNTLTKPASHPHLAAGSDKQDSMMSKSSIEVADIMQSSWETKPAVNKLVEPAMISIVLHDVDGNVSNDRLLETASSLSVTHSVDQSPDLLNISTSRSPSMSASPVPNSPVTVIEVGLDNANDSLDVEENDHFLSLNDVTERRHSTGGLHKRQEQAKSLKSSKRRSSLVTRKEITDSHSVHDSFEYHGMEGMNSSFTHDLFTLKPDAVYSNSCDHLISRDVHIQADDGRLSPIIEFAIDDMFNSGEPHNGNDCDDDVIFYMAADCSTQCDLLLDSGLKTTSLISKSHTVSVEDKCVQANSSVNSQSESVSMKSRHVNSSAQTESSESVNKHFNDKSDVAATLTGEYEYGKDFPHAEKYSFSQSMADTVDSVVNLLSLQSCPLREGHFTGLAGEDQSDLSLGRQALDPVDDRNQTSTIQNAEGQCHLSNTDLKQEFKQMFLLGRSFDSDKYIGSQPAGDSKESKMIMLPVSAPTEEIPPCSEVEMLLQAPYSHGNECQNVNHEQPLPDDSISLYDVIQTPDSTSSSTVSDKHPQMSVPSNRSHLKSVHVADTTSGLVRSPCLLTVPQGNHSKDKCSQYLSVSAERGATPDTSSDVDKEFDFFFTKVDEASGIISPDSSVHEVESLFLSLSTDDFGSGVNPSQLSVCNTPTTRPHSPLPRQMSEEGRFSSTSVSTERRARHRLNTRQCSEDSALDLTECVVGSETTQSGSVSVLNHNIKDDHVSQVVSSKVRLPSDAVFKQDLRYSAPSPYVMVSSEECRQEGQDVLLNEQCTTQHSLEGTQPARQETGGAKSNLLSVGSPAGSKPVSPLHTSDADSDFDELNCFDSHSLTEADNRPPIPKIFIKNHSDEVNVAEGSNIQPDTSVVGVANLRKAVVTNAAFSVLINNSSAYFKPVESPLSGFHRSGESLFGVREHLNSMNNLTIGCSVPGCERTRSASCEPVLRVPIPLKRYSVPLFDLSDDDSLNTVSLGMPEPCRFLSENSSFRVTSKNRSSYLLSPRSVSHQSVTAASHCNSLPLERNTLESCDELFITDQNGTVNAPVLEECSKQNHFYNSDTSEHDPVQGQVADESQGNNFHSGPSIKYSEFVDINCEIVALSNKSLDIDIHSISTSRSTHEVDNTVLIKTKSGEISNNLCLSETKEQFKIYLSSGPPHQLSSPLTEEPQDEPASLVSVPSQQDKCNQDNKISQQNTDPVADQQLTNSAKTVQNFKADGLTNSCHTPDRANEISDTLEVPVDLANSNNYSQNVSSPGSNGKRFKSSLTLFISESGNLKPVVMHTDPSADNSITVFIDEVHLQTQADNDRTSTVHSDDHMDKQYEPFSRRSHSSESKQCVFDQTIHPGNTCCVKPSCDLQDELTEQFGESYCHTYDLENNENNIQNHWEEPVKNSCKSLVSENAEELHEWETKQRTQYPITNHIQQDTTEKQMVMSSTHTQVQVNNHVTKPSTGSVPHLSQTVKYFSAHTNQHRQSSDRQKPQYGEENTPCIDKTSSIPHPDNAALSECVSCVEDNSSTPPADSRAHTRGVMADHYITKHSIPHDDWEVWRHSEPCAVTNQEPGVSYSRQPNKPRYYSSLELTAKRDITAESCKTSPANSTSTYHKNSRDISVQPASISHSEISTDSLSKHGCIISISEDSFNRYKDCVSASEDGQSRSHWNDLISDSQSSSVDISEIFENSKVYLASDSADFSFTKHTRKKRNPVGYSTEDCTALQHCGVNTYRSKSPQKSASVMAMKEKFENRVVNNSEHTCFEMSGQTKQATDLKTVSVKNITRRFEQNAK